MATMQNIGETKIRTPLGYKRGLFIKRSFIYLILAALAIICILPLYIMLVNATRPNDQIVAGLSLVPGQSLWDNLQTLILGKLDRSTGVRGGGLNIPLGFLNSFVIALGATVMSAYFGALAAYGFAVYKFKGQSFVWACILAVIMIPSTVGLIGYYKMISAFDMINTFWPLILPAGANAFAVFFLRSYMQGSLSMSLIEAARIDGKSEVGIFHSIALPLSMPGIATISILGFLGNWNSYLIPLIVLNDKNLFTMPIMIQQLNTTLYNRDLGAMYSGVAISIVPIMIMFAFFSKYMIEGISAGGVKE